MSQPNPLELAKQGHPKAIESLINRQMQPKGITAKVALKNNCLHIMLEAAQPPDQKALVPVIRKGITNLGIPSIEILKIYGKQLGEQVPAWSQEFELVGQQSSLSNLNVTPSIASNEIQQPQYNSQEKAQQESQVKAHTKKLAEVANQQNIKTKSSISTTFFVAISLGIIIFIYPFIIIFAININNTIAWGYLVAAFLIPLLFAINAKLNNKPFQKVVRWFFYGLVSFIILSVLAAFILISFYSKTETTTSTVNRTLNISQSEMGDKWPFTVDQGEISCIPPNTVIFRYENKIYAVNGTAEATGKYLDILPIWKDDPKVPPELKLKISISPIIDKGLELCK